MGTPQDECDRLKALLGDRARGAFAAAIGLPGGASMLSQHLSGNRPISLDAGIRYARGFGVDLDQISPRLADEVRAGMQVLKDRPAAHHLAEPAAPWSQPMSLPDALDRLGLALGNASPDVLEALAVNLAGWARAGGSGPWSGMVLTLLTSSPGKQRANSR